MITPADIPAIARKLDPTNVLIHANTRSATVFCPVCDYQKPTLVLRPKNGKFQAFCISGCDHKAVWRAVLDASKGAVFTPPPEQLPVQAEITPDQVEQFKKWQAKWNRAIDACDHPIARKYLETRRCVIPPKGSPIRALDSLWHYKSETSWPALITRCDNATTLKPSTFHTTFLATDGSDKASVDPPRLTASSLPLHGAVVRCTETESTFAALHLGIAEGIESALSLAHFKRDQFTHVWATITSGNMKVLPVITSMGIPPKTLTIAVDPDRAGEDAAMACARRWHAAGVKVRLIRPKDGDINDLVRARS